MLKPKAVPWWKTVFQISEHGYSPSVFPLLTNARTTRVLHRRNVLEGAGRHTFRTRRLLNSIVGTKVEVLSMVMAMSHNNWKSHVRT